MQDEASFEARAGLRVFRTRGSSLEPGNRDAGAGFSSPGAGFHRAAQVSRFRQVMFLLTGRRSQSRDGGRLRGTTAGCIHYSAVRGPARGSRRPPAAPTAAASRGRHARRVGRRIRFPGRDAQLRTSRRLSQRPAGRMGCGAATMRAARGTRRSSRRPRRFVWSVSNCERLRRKFQP